MEGKFLKPQDGTCNYCLRNEQLKSSLIEICQLNVSTFYLSKEQTYKGRSIVVLNWHVTELFSLEKEQLHLFAEDVSKAARALSSVFQPRKINYAIYGDLVPHLHVHLAPKYKDGYTWGRPFEANPEDKVMLRIDEYNKMIAEIKSAL